MFFNAAVGTPQSAADAVRAFWGAVNNVISSGYVLQVEPLVYEIDSTTGKATGTHGTTTAQLTPTGGGDRLPGNVNGLVRWHTGLFINGRELVGKTWIPGPTETSNTNGLPDAAYQTALNTGASGLDTTATADLCIWSRKHLQFFTVTSSSAWTQWGSLRSRRQ